MVFWSGLVGEAGGRVLCVSDRTAHYGHSRQLLDDSECIFRDSFLGAELNLHIQQGERRRRNSNRVPSLLLLPLLRRRDSFIIVINKHNGANYRHPKILSVDVEEVGRREGKSPWEE